MLSERSRAHWEAFTARATEPGPLIERAELHLFLVGAHVRGEEVTAHELKELLERAGLGDDDRSTLTWFVPAGLGLLATYDAVLGAERRAYRDEGGDDGVDV